MQETLNLILTGALAVALLSVAATRLKLPPSVFLLAAGAALSFVPGMPQLALDPDLVLLLLLPPLLYAAGVGMSWRGFRSNLRPILLLAVGCVVFTAAAVAAVGHFLLGLPWAVGFVLGAIVSPPDAVAPMAIARRLGLPRRILTILEGESLVNDATALTIFGFALAAVASGQFSLGRALGQFALLVAGEIGFGIAIGWAALRLRHVVRDAKAEILLALATPFAAFWPPHLLGGSGVIACVTAGLWISWNGRTLIRPATRLQGFFIWDLVVWGIEGLVFLLTGTQASSVARAAADSGWTRLLLAGAAVSATVIIVRYLWVYPATYLPRILSASLRTRDPSPGWQTPFLIAFTGLRGVVSLAAALSIPLMLDGKSFPDRDLILFATFSVIVVTLIGQGLLLPPVIRWLGLAKLGRAEAAAHNRDEQKARLEGLDAVLARLDQCDGKDGPRRVIASLRARHADRRAHIAESADEATPCDPVREATALQLELVRVERAAIARAYDENRITDEARRRIEREFDLEEARAIHAGGGDSLEIGVAPKGLE